MVKKISLIIITLLCVTGCSLLNRGVDEKTNSEEILDINSGLVRNLYMYVENDNRCFNTITSADQKEINAQDIDYETKFGMAVEIMLESDKKTFDCNTYDYSKYNGSSEYAAIEACGDNYYDLKTNKFKNNDNIAAYAEILKEDKIKIRMEQIFGKGTYEHKDEIIYNARLYKYIAEEKGYVILSVPLGGTCPGHENELMSATKINDNIIINERNIFENEENFVYDYAYTYTFNSADKSYYLTSIKSEKKVV